MTVDEAIICLSDMKIKVAIPKAAIQARLNNDALNMAIEALRCSEIPNSSDTISRQKAIDTLRKMQTYKLFAGDDMLLINQAEAQAELMMLPSAQPDDDRLERCRFEYANACKILAHRTPDTSKKDIDDAYAVVRTLYPIFEEESF